jgi:hypothetical protein
MAENTYKYIETLVNAGLVSEFKPANYDFNIENGIEPSCNYTPVYNLSKVEEANLKERGSDSAKKAEVNFQKTEVNFDNVEDVFSYKEYDSDTTEVDYVKRELNPLEKEGELPF